MLEYEGCSCIYLIVMALCITLGSISYHIMLGPITIGFSYHLLSIKSDPDVVLVTG